MAGAPDEEEPWDLGDDLEASSSGDLQREWSSRRTHFHTLGYRDGIEAGKNSAVQEAFEAGYGDGVKAGYRCGMTRGWTSAFTALPESAQRLLLDGTASLRIQQSQAELSAISSDKALRLFYSGICRTQVLEDGKERSPESLSTLPVNTREDHYTAVVGANQVENLHMEIKSVLKSSGLAL